MANDEEQIARDREQLDHLEEEIDEARGHLKQQEHQPDHYFLEPTPEGPTDDAIVPPG